MNLMVVDQRPAAKQVEKNQEEKKTFTLERSWLLGFAGYCSTLFFGTFFKSPNGFCRPSRQLTNSKKEVAPFST
jgi:hypothetical protein